MHKQRSSFSRSCQIPSWKETPFVKPSMGPCFENKHLVTEVFTMIINDHNACYLIRLSTQVSAFPVGCPSPLPTPSSSSLKEPSSGQQSGLVGCCGREYEPMIACRVSIPTTRRGLQLSPQHIGHSTVISPSSHYLPIMQQRSWGLLFNSLLCFLKYPFWKFSETKHKKIIYFITNGKLRMLQISYLQTLGRTPKQTNME